MTDPDRQKTGGKSARNKKKRNRKAEPQQTPEQARAVSKAIDAAMAEPVAAVADATPMDNAPTDSFVETAASAAPAEAPASAPAERVASFRERMASVMAAEENASDKPAAPTDVAPQATPASASAPVAGIQAIANAYRDYTRKSLEDAQAFAENLSAARSLDKAVEAQTEFARQACQTFADNSRRIRELHRELFWQAFRLPNWPLDRSR